VVGRNACGFEASGASPGFVSCGAVVLVATGLEAPPLLTSEDIEGYADCNQISLWRAKQLPLSK
jgi:hypothetical protein